MRLTRARIILISIGLTVAVTVLALGCASSESKPAPSASPPTGAADTKGEANRLAPLSPGSGAEVVPGQAYSGSAPADGASGGTSAASDQQFQALLDRKIVQNSSIDLGVSEVGRAFQDIIAIATTAGGFVASSSFSNQDNQQVADLTIRVPADKYQDVLGQIRGKGKVGQESSDANDVTEQYTDLQARLRTLQATEQRYLDLLSRAETVNDILPLQDRLDSVRGQIEQAQGQINVLDHLTTLATITVHLRPLAAAGAQASGGGIHPLRAAEGAWEASLSALRGVAAAALVIVVFSWWLVPPAIAIGFGARWWAARRPRPVAPEQPA